METTAFDVDVPIKFWTLLDEDRALLAGERGAPALGFAVLLKHYSRHGQFPRGRAEVPDDVIVFVAGQLGVDAADLGFYEWSGSTIEYHRARPGTISATASRPSLRWCSRPWQAVSRRLRELVREFKTRGPVYRCTGVPVYRRTVRTTLRASYTGHYRRGLIALLEVLEFRSNNSAHRPVIDALGLLSCYAKAGNLTDYPLGESVPSHRNERGLVGSGVPGRHPGRARVTRMVCEVVTFKALREQLRCREIWVVGADSCRELLAGLHRLKDLVLQGCAGWSCWSTRGRTSCRAWAPRRASVSSRSALQLLRREQPTSPHRGIPRGMTDDHGVELLGST